MARNRYRYRHDSISVPSVSYNGSSSDSDGKGLPIIAIVAIFVAIFLFACICDGIRSYCLNSQEENEESNETRIVHIAIIPKNKVTTVKQANPIKKWSQIGKHIIYFLCILYNYEL